MDSCSLKIGHLSHNDICNLAEILEDNFKYYCSCFSPFEQDYLREIETVVGLGFTAVLVDGFMISSYYSRLQIFLGYIDFKKHQGSLSYLSMQIAEMISIAAWIFGSLGYPAYYESFASSIRKIFRRANLKTVKDMGHVEDLLKSIIRL